MEGGVFAGMVHMQDVEHHRQSVDHAAKIQIRKRYLFTSVVKLVSPFRRRSALPRELFFFQSLFHL